MAGRITRYQHRATEQAPGAPHRDIGLTRKWMDSMGVDVACVFPTPMLGLGLNPIVEVEVQYARAYNRWLTEQILAHEPRMVSMLYLPMNDPEAALKMVEEFSGRKGVIGFLVTTVRYKPLYDNAYMKLYAALEERGLPIALPLRRRTGATRACTSRTSSSRSHALGFTWFNIVHMTNWVVNGIPERFPGLKSIWIESGLAWIPFLMQRLDNEYMMRSSEAPSLKRKPSDYMREMYLHLAADGDDQQHDDAARDVQDDRRRDAASLFVGLSALGHGPAVDDLRSAVPQPAGEAEHPRRKRAQAVQARHADLGREEGAAESPRGSRSGGVELLS